MSAPSQTPTITARSLFERKWRNEGRDDLAKLPLPPESKTYARMKASSDVMNQPGGTAKKWHKSMELRKTLTNQKDVKDFAPMDKGQKVDHAFKESLANAVADMLD